MRVLVRTHAAKLNALHRSRGGWSPLWWRGLGRRLRLLLLLLLLKRGQDGGLPRGRAGLLLREHARHASVNVRVVGLNTAEVLPHGGQLIPQKLILFLRPPTILGVGPQSSIL